MKGCGGKSVCHTGAPLEGHRRRRSAEVDGGILWKGMGGGLEEWREESDWHAVLRLQQCVLAMGGAVEHRAGLGTGLDWSVPHSRGSESFAFNSTEPHHWTI